LSIVSISPADDLDVCKMQTKESCHIEIVTEALREAGLLARRLLVGGYSLQQPETHLGIKILIVRWSTRGGGGVRRGSYVRVCLPPMI